LKDLGMVLPPSYITPEIQATRDSLVDLHNKYSYYKSHLEPLLNSYPLNGLDSNYKV